jgi:hypothetical protein
LLFVYGITAALKDSHAGFYRQRLPSGDHPAPTTDYRAKGVRPGDAQSRTPHRE